MMKYKSLLVLAILLIASLILGACTDEEGSNASEEDAQSETESNESEAASSNANSNEGVTIRYAHFQPGDPDQPKQAAALAFKSYVEQNTNGSVTVDIYPASQLGDEATTLEGVQLGSIQMTVIHDGPITSIYEPMGVFNMPYLFKDQGQAWTVFDSEYTKELGEDMREKTGIRMLGMADNGIRHFTNSKREIRSPEDMSDLVMRIQPGPLYEQLIEATGASSSVVPWPELPAALQQGVVDGQENGVTNILAASLFESQDYVSLDGHIYSYHAYLISDEFYTSLSEDQQAVIQEGVDLAKWIHRGMTANQDMNAASILAENGMQVTTLTEEEIDVFREATQPVVADWMREEMGEKWVDDLLELVDSLD